MLSVSEPFFSFPQQKTSLHGYNDSLVPGNWNLLSAPVVVRRSREGEFFTLEKPGKHHSFLIPAQRRKVQAEKGEKASFVN
jgi:hypothetical protein